MSRSLRPCLCEQGNFERSCCARNTKHTCPDFLCETTTALGNIAAYSASPPSGLLPHPLTPPNINSYSSEEAANLAL